MSKRKPTLQIFIDDTAEDVLNSAKSKANLKLRLRLQNLEKSHNLKDMRTLLAILDNLFNVEYIVK